jgi:hypothetical protein
MLCVLCSIGNQLVICQKYCLRYILEARRIMVYIVLQNSYDELDLNSFEMQIVRFMAENLFFSLVFCVDRCFNFPASI